jgi:hypothetical protein
MRQQLFNLLWFFKTSIQSFWQKTEKPLLKNKGFVIFSGKLILAIVLSFSM